MELINITPILQRVFPGQKIFLVEMSRADISEWDSISHLSLIVELEDEFDISFSKQEIQEIDSIHKILMIIQNKI